MKGSDLLRIAIVPPPWATCLVVMVREAKAGAGAMRSCGAIYRADDRPAPNQPQHGRTRPHMAE